MKLTEDEPKSIEIENGIVKITFVDSNPHSDRIDEPIIRTIEFQSDTLQKMKEDAKNWNEFIPNKDIYTFVNREKLNKLQEDAEILQRLEYIFKPHFEKGVTEFVADILNGKIDLDYNGRNKEIVEHLKNFFNADNVLTKSEYKQKILREEK